MSCYMNFYLRLRDGKFLPMNTYSRGSAMFNLFEGYAPYERVKAVDLNTFLMIIREAENKIADYKRVVSSEKENQKLIASMNNSIDEKLRALDESNQGIKEVEEMINDLTIALGGIFLLRDFVEDAEISYKYEDNFPYYDTNGIFYVGIESGMAPTNEDVVD